MLAGEPDLQIVGEASSGREALELCRRWRPDLVLLDVRMPDLNGLEAAEAISRACPTAKVMFVTIYENPAYLVNAVKVGAAGYVLKDASRNEVIASIRRVLEGERLLGACSTAARQRTAGMLEPGVDLLTPREQDVLRLLARGQTNREIAGNLGIGVGTVKIHVQHIISKLGASDRTHAAVRAMELGYLLPDPGSRTPAGQPDTPMFPDMPKVPRES